MAKKEKGTKPETIEDDRLDDAKGGGELADFHAFSSTFTGGVRVAVGDVDSEDPDLKIRS